MQDRKELTILLIYFLVKKNQRMQIELLANNIIGNLIQVIEKGIHLIKNIKRIIIILIIIKDNK